ncbi:MAG: acyl carrier protein [Candidatus Omnitrophica bacterium]|nr:acyl carrier protein [Candidatus Omnitrophota bacterium]
MTQDEILQDLVAFVRRTLPGFEVSGATDVQKDVPFDSLDRMELLARIEQRYGVSVMPEQYLDERLQVLTHLAAFIAAQPSSKRLRSVER